MKNYFKTVHNEENLCRFCTLNFGDCTHHSDKFPVFGVGISNDNVVECDSFADAGYGVCEGDEPIVIEVPTEDTKVITRYFTFGQTHIHSYNGITLDKNVIVKITAEHPRDVMVGYFGTIWAFEYDSLDKLTLEYYPRGVFNINTNTFE